MIGTMFKSPLEYKTPPLEGAILSRWAADAPDR